MQGSRKRRGSSPTVAAAALALVACLWSGADSASGYPGAATSGGYPPQQQPPQQQTPQQQQYNQQQQQQQQQYRSAGPGQTPPSGGAGGSGGGVPQGPSYGRGDGRGAMPPQGYRGGPPPNPNQQQQGGYGRQPQGQGGGGGGYGGSGGYPSAQGYGDRYGGGGSQYAPQGEPSQGWQPPSRSGMALQPTGPSRGPIQSGYQGQDGGYGGRQPISSQAPQHHQYSQPQPHHAGGSGLADSSGMGLWSRFKGKVFRGDSQGADEGPPRWVWGHIRHMHL